MNSLERTFLKAYDSYSNAIFRHCYFRVFNRERAKELAQEAFMKTWQYLAAGQEVKNIRAFLYRVANNLIIDESRKKKEQSLEKLQEDGFEPADESFEKLQRLLQGGEILRILRKLPEKYREVVQLRFIDDLSPKEIAEVIGETENNISVRIHRGLQQLRNILEYS